MARRRMLHASFFKSKTMAQLPYRARITFMGLWVYADDDGRALDDLRLIKAEVWPQDDDVTVTEIAQDLTAINTLGGIVRYEKRGLKCFAIPTWRKYQTISHKTPSKLPAPPRVSRKAPESLRLFPEDLRPNVVEVSSTQRSRSSARARAKTNGGVHAHEAENLSEGRRAVQDVKAKLKNPTRGVS